MRFHSRASAWYRLMGYAGSGPTDCCHILTCSPAFLWLRWPLLARGSALRFLLTRLVDFLNVPPGALGKPKDPLEYVRKLRFQQGVSGLNDYGVVSAGCVA